MQWLGYLMHEQITRAITELSHVLRELKHVLTCSKSQDKGATKGDLDLMESHIMSAIQDFATAQNAFNDQIDNAVTGLSGDIKNLNDQIAKLQSTPGAITPEDQILLDSIQARSKSIADKLNALDAMTPPVPPTTV